MTALLAIRAARRAADAAWDAALLIEEGKSGEARMALDESHRHLNRATEQLPDAEDGQR